MANEKKFNSLPVLSILGFNYLAVIIPIPTALGSHEAIQSFAFNAFGLGASAATAFTMIIRGAEVLVALLGALFLFKLGIEVIKNIIFERLERVRKRVYLQK